MVKLSTNLLQIVDCRIAAHENFAQTRQRTVIMFISLLGGEMGITI